MALPLGSDDLCALQTPSAPPPSHSSHFQLCVSFLTIVTLEPYRNYVCVIKNLIRAAIAFKLWQSARINARLIFIES